MVKEKVSKAKVKELASGAPSQGNCEIRLRNPKRSGTITVRGYTGEDGQYRPYVDQYGNERVLRIKRTIYLNMEKMDDRLTLEQVRLHPIYVQGSTPVLVIVNHESEADAFVAKKDLEANSMAIISKLEGEDLRDFARILLIKVKPGSSDKIIKRSLYDLATDNPGEIINEWNDDRRELKVIIRKGIEKGVFVHKLGRFSYGDEMMGMSFEQAVDWLNSNQDLIPSLRKKLK